MSRSASSDAEHVLRMARDAAHAAARLLGQATEAVRSKVIRDGQLAPSLLDREQRAAHGLAWFATYATALEQLAISGERLAQAGRLGEGEQLLIRIGAGEYLAQMLGGIPMSQGEIARPFDLGLAPADLARHAPLLEGLLSEGNTPANRGRLVELMRDREDAIAADGGDDATLQDMRREMRRFTDAEVAPHAHDWHLANGYIPLPLIARMAELGVFGLTIPERYGGLGLGKEAMCVVSEELARGYIGVGSLGTRSEIAAELILSAGAAEQKRRWLPAIAAGEVLPTAVFTEPDFGSDLASLKTRAVREDGVYRVYGSKTWITHAARADLMTLLVRTDPGQSGYSGLSILLAEKPRGSDSDPFPVQGLSGTEIEVIGYRGMKEYELAFDGFAVSADSLLGGVEGEGFKQLMQTFESARIQTAARAVGVAEGAVELALRYAKERVQFGAPLIGFPRVADKIAMMAVEIAMARALTHFAARQKDSGRRCDLEAGMAKLLAARVAWAAADNGVQIHGGNGFAVEFPISRILSDARILSIFEGSAEIQAQVIARRLLAQAN